MRKFLFGVGFGLVFLFSVAAYVSYNHDNVIARGYIAARTALAEAASLMVQAKNGTQPIYRSYNSSGTLLESVSATGHHSFTSTATYKQRICISPFEMDVTSGATDATMTSIDIGGGTGYSIMLPAFETAADDYVLGRLVLPKGTKSGTALSPSIVWAPSSTNTATASWGLQYVHKTTGGTLQYLTRQQKTVTPGGTALKTQEDALTDISCSTCDDESEVLFKLTRQATRWSDTFTGSAYLLDLCFEVEMDSWGSDS